MKSKLRFPTNLQSFVSFGKTHKLHNDIDQRLARLAGQAHVALHGVIMEERRLFTRHSSDRSAAASQKEARRREALL